MKEARFDIVAHLHYGDMTNVARKYGINKSHLTAMLYGRRNANIEAIRELEQLAANNVWKERFCKNESLL